MQIRLRLYLLIFAFFLFILDYIFVLTSSTQITFLIGVLILFGVPHGALDLYIDKHLHKSDSNQKIFLLKYIANIIIYSLVWYFFPVMAILIFIFITAFHFGEIDWMGKSNKLIHKIVYTAIGFAWITFLLTKNIEFALDIFLNMGRSNFTKLELINIAGKIYPVSIIFLTIVYPILFIFKNIFFEKTVYYYYAIIQLIILFFFVMYMPLWLSFAFYFGFWHSLLSFDKIRITFEISNTLKGWIGLLIKAAPFSIMAWFGFAFIAFLTLNSHDRSGVFTLLFITLSVLALPHLQIFTKIKLKSE